MGIATHRFDNAKRRRPDNHVRQSMLTPAYVLEPLRELLGSIDLDPCTEPDNPTRAGRFYHLPMDGCALPWDAPTVFCNPPYGEARARWVDRCIEEGSHRRVVLLIPAHTETIPFQRAVTAADSCMLIRGRLKFGVLREKGLEKGGRIQEAASHGSALIGFGVDLSPLQLPGVSVRNIPYGDNPQQSRDLTSKGTRIWLAMKGNKESLRLAEVDGWEVREVAKAVGAGLTTCDMDEDESR